MKFNLRTLVQVSLLIAIEIVLSRFLSIATPYVKISFGFVPLAICAMLYGPVWAGIAAGLADFIGAILFPIGAYFPGFTLSALLTGVVLGLLLYKQEKSPVRIGFAVCVNGFVISLFLTTLWIHLLYGAPYLGLLPPRLIQNLIMAPIQFVVILLMQRPITLYAKKHQPSVAG